MKARAFVRQLSCGESASVGHKCPRHQSARISFAMRLTEENENALEKDKDGFRRGAFIKTSSVRKIGEVREMA